MRKALCLTAVLVEFAVAALALATTLPWLYHAALYRPDRIEPVASSYIAFLVLVAVAATFVYAAGRGARPSALALAGTPLLLCLLCPVRWLLGAGPFFLEPLLISAASGAAIALALLCAARTQRMDGGGSGRGMWPVVLILASWAAASVWLYLVQAEALAKLAYGYVDGGIYYLRIRNTALGCGFLQETLLRPPFYDHFDIGLLVLVPLYWLVRSAKTVMIAQAVFLAACGPMMYVYARGRGLSARHAALAGLAALFYPSISQMSLAFTYGFHPVSLSIPAVILSFYFWERGKWWQFAAAAIFAMSMEETVMPLYVGMGLVELVVARGKRWAGLVLLGASAGLFVVVTRVIMPEFAGDARYFQMAKFAHLGDSVGEILLSPFRRPGVFWGLVFSRQSLIFVTVLLASVGFLPLFAPRKLLYPAVVLVFVLLLSNPDVKSICFQYQVMIVAAWLPAAVDGAGRLTKWLSERRGYACGPASGAILASLAATALFASFFHGMLPWSRNTIPFQTRRDPQFMDEAAALREFAALVPSQARVLATMRAATLFLEAAEVTPLQEWQGSTDYDLVVLQQDDMWGAHQTGAEKRLVFDTMTATGAFTAENHGRFCVMWRPGTGLYWPSRQSRDWTDDAADLLESLGK